MLDDRHQKLGKKTVSDFERRFMLCSKWGKWVQMLEAGVIVTQHLFEIGNIQDRLLNM